MISLYSELNKFKLIKLGSSFSCFSYCGCWRNGCEGELSGCGVIFRALAVPGAALRLAAAGVSAPCGFPPSLTPTLPLPEPQTQPGVGLGELPFLQDESKASSQLVGISELCGNFPGLTFSLPVTPRDVASRPQGLSQMQGILSPLRRVWVTGRLWTLSIRSAGWI